MRRAVIECGSPWVTALTGRPQWEKRAAASENQPCPQIEKAQDCFVFFPSLMLPENQI